MKQYDRIHWEYTDHEKLELDKCALSNAKMKYGIAESYHGKDRRQESIKILSESIKERIIYIKDNY